MIAGIVAAQGAAASVGGSGVPEDALLYLDFINGTYSVNGVTAAAADVISHPALVTADGLALRFADETDAGDVVTDLIGDALAVLLTADWTLMLEYEELTDSSVTIPLSIQNADLSDTIQLQRLDDPGGQYYLYDTDGTDTRERGTAAEVNSGIHKVAITRTDAELAIAADGGVVNTTSTTLSGLAPTTASFGNFSGDFLFNEINIRRLTVWAPRPDADLPALSA